MLVPQGELLETLQPRRAEPPTIKSLLLKKTLPLNLIEAANHLTTFQAYGSNTIQSHKHTSHQSQDLSFDIIQNGMLHRVDHNTILSHKHTSHQSQDLSFDTTQNGMLHRVDRPCRPNIQNKYQIKKIFAENHKRKIIEGKNWERQIYSKKNKDQKPHKDASRKSLHMHK